MKLDGDLHRRLLAVAADHGCTTFMVLQAGIAVLLSRLGPARTFPSAPRWRGVWTTRWKASSDSS